MISEVTPLPPDMVSQSSAETTKRVEEDSEEAIWPSRTVPATVSSRSSSPVSIRRVSPAARS